MGSERLAMGYGRRELITWHTLPHPVQFWVRNSAGDEIEVEGWARARPRLGAATYKYMQFAR